MSLILKWCFWKYIELERVVVGLSESDDPAQRLDEDQHHRRRSEMVQHFIQQQSTQIAFTRRLFRMRFQRSTGALCRPSSNGSIVIRRRSERRGRRGGGDWSRMKNKIRIIKNNNNKLFNTGRSLLSTRIPAVRDVFDEGLRWIVVQQHRPVASRDSSWVSGRSDGTIGSSHLADIMPIIAEVIAEAAAAAEERQSRSSVTIRTSSIRCVNNCRWRWKTSTKRIRAKRRNC